ncbi:MAG: hypothetical protein MRY83_07900, partial [Flavobacteriales bacterium]|nr:hypothetical protein [Flavobacteriales bacterium]
MKNTIYILMLSSILFVSCREEGCTDIDAINFKTDAKKDDGSCEYNGTVKLHLHNNAGSSALNLGTVYTTSSGARITFTDAQFYITEVRLKSESGNVDAPMSNHVIHNGQSSYQLGEFSPGSYSNLSFNIGVDSVQNHADPSAADAPEALSANNDNFEHWSWNTGYRFVVLEGFVDTTAGNNGTPNVEFQYHI